MRLAKTVRFGAWLLIGLNLLMALGSIWTLMRMAPAIAEIIDRNERSLEACEEMIATLATMSEDAGTNALLEKQFEKALQRAQNNITEKEEPMALQMIKSDFRGAFKGDLSARKRTVSSVLLLAKSNREAMIIADNRAQQLGFSGAWGVVFMAVVVFFAGMLFKRTLARSLVNPLEEIHKVMSAHLDGDTLRRCSGADIPKDIKILFTEINDYIDKAQTERSQTVLQRHAKP